MKITMTYQDESINRSISVDEFMELTEIFEVFRAFLFLAGYQPETIADGFAQFDPADPRHE